MKLNYITFQNFRCFEEFTLRLDSPSFNVIIGEKQSGKTSLLDGIAYLLGGYFIGSDFFARAAKLNENSRGSLLISGVAEVDSPDGGSYLIEWQRNCSDRKSLTKPIRDLEQEHRAILFRQQTKSCGESYFCLPIFCYYGANRLSEKGNHRQSKDGLRGMKLEASQAYTNCLSSKYDEWILTFVEELAMQSLEEKDYKSKDHKSLALKMLEDVIVSCIPDVKKFHYSYKERTCFLTFNNDVEVRFDDLPKGHKDILLMVADIARRSILLNPNLGGDLFKQQTGIVLIDDIEMYLEPQWHQSVVDSLRRTFPSLQFIITTNSPSIVRGLKSNELVNI